MTIELARELATKVEVCALLDRTGRNDEAVIAELVTIALDELICMGGV